MALWTCPDCQAAYAVGLLRCPHCGRMSDNFREAGMPKTSIAGASNALGQPLEPEPDPVQAEPAVPEPAAQEPPEGEASPEPASASEALPEPPAEPEEPEAAAEEAAEPEDQDEDEGPVDYSTYPKTVLTELCRDRGLMVTGTKAELAERLAAYDEEREAT
jgi:hypothetical protein